MDSEPNSFSFNDSRLASGDSTFGSSDAASAFSSVLAADFALDFLAALVTLALAAGTDSSCVSDYLSSFYPLKSPFISCMSL